MLTEGRKQAKIPKDAPVLRWNEFLRRGRGYHWTYRVERRAGDEAVILYSGGTTGVTKGIQLTNLNFNALGKQIIATNPMFRPGDKMLAVMPMFHGFGLGVSIHSMLVSGGCCILVPRFTPDSYAKLLLKYRCVRPCPEPQFPPVNAPPNQESPLQADLFLRASCFH